MAGTIGGYACELVKGHCPPLKMRTRTWQVPGLNGYGAQALGLGDSTGRFTAVKFGSYATVTTWLALIDALQGTVITVVTDWGATFAAFFLQRVSEPRITANSPYGARLEIDLEGVRTA